jgi:hypothetical protein
MQGSEQKYMHAVYIYFYKNIIFILVENFYIRDRIIRLWNLRSQANKLHW